MFIFNINLTVWIDRNLLSTCSRAVIEENFEICPVETPEIDSNLSFTSVEENVEIWPLENPRLTEICCSIHDHSWRKSWIWSCETSHSKRNPLLTSSWFKKSFRFDIVNCLDRLKFTVHFFATVEENLEIWSSEITHIDKNSLVTHSPWLKKILKFGLLQSPRLTEMY